MKKVYQKPEVEKISIVSQEDITMEGGALEGSIGVEDSDGVVWQ